MSDAPVLVVGCPRSGTTLLRDLLRSHPRLSFPPESRWIPWLFRAYGDPDSAAQARRIAADLLNSWEITTWQLGLRPPDLEHHRTFAGLVAQLYETWAAREGKARWGDKTPLYVLELDTMLRLFPAAQVINLVRDGRDVALSLMAQPWGPSNPYTAAVMWRRSIRAGVTAADSLPSSRLLDVRYEALLSDPEVTLRRICRFLGEPFTPQMLVPSRLPTPSGRPNPWPAHREMAIDGGNSGGWRDQMTLRARATFEAVAGPELRTVGYAPSVVPHPPSGLARAAFRLEDALRWLVWRSTTLDRAPRLRTTLILGRARFRGWLRAAGAQR